ncbi:hypothetical protein BJ878DRAFT_477695 [Calycina marina]|uniref:C2H2-type domain-containing protein n=1 Tax=Calycina marina TaxID=1763456 RepID=A0A9P7Z8A4_9HELO|nr:hypothetical protein BJ878DRAFT_477695 [Calycina marina]
MSTTGVNEHGKRSREPELEHTSSDKETTSSHIPSYSPYPEQPPVSSSKILHLDAASGVQTKPVTQMLCSLAGHRQTLSFATYEEYEVHYNKAHVNRCLECRKNFPSEHFLSLHIEETHDALVAVKRERGDKTYFCFVEDCDKKCSTPQKRRMHLIDKHMFPKDYDFFIVKDGIDRRSSMLRSGRHRRKSSAAQNSTGSSSKGRSTGEIPLSKIRGLAEDASLPTPPVESKPPTLPSSKADEEMKDLAGAMSSLKFVPPSVRFGRGRGRGFSRS